MKSLLTTDLRDAWRSLRATPVVTLSRCCRWRSVSARTPRSSRSSTASCSSRCRSTIRQQLALLDEGDWTNPIWEEIRGARGEKSGQSALAWSSTRFDLAERARRIPWTGPGSAASMFDVLGMQPCAGADHHMSRRRAWRRSGRAVAVISYAHVATALRRRRGRDRPHDHHRASAVHHRRRDPPRDSSGPRSAARSTWSSRSAPNR